MSSRGKRPVFNRIPKFPEFVQLVSVFKVGRYSIAYVSHLWVNGIFLMKPIPNLCNGKTCMGKVMADIVADVCDVARSFSSCSNMREHRLFLLVWVVGLDFVRENDGPVLHKIEMLHETSLFFALFFFCVYGFVLNGPDLIVRNPSPASAFNFCINARQSKVRFIIPPASHAIAKSSASSRITRRSNAKCRSLSQFPQLLSKYSFDGDRHRHIDSRLAMPICLSQTHARAQCSACMHKLRATAYASKWNFVRPHLHCAFCAFLDVHFETHQWFPDRPSHETFFL